MYSHHKFGHEWRALSRPRVSYMVCSTPRSGSSLLCDVLASTELAGAPTEYFDRNQMNAFFESWNVRTLDEYVEALLSKKTSPNGVFGLKVHYGQFLEISSDRHVMEALPNLHCIYIRRRHHLRQAVSWWRAIQTEQWASDHPIRNPEPIRFDADQIGSLLAQIEQQEEGWESFFRARSVRPLRIVYEDMVDALEDTIAGVFRFLGIEVPPNFALGPPTIEKQADDLSEEWVRRYELISRART